MLDFELIEKGLANKLVSGDELAAVLVLACIDKLRLMREYINLSDRLVDANDCSRLSKSTLFSILHSMSVNGNQLKAS